MPITWLEIEKRRIKWDRLFYNSLKKFFLDQGKNITALRLQDLETFRVHALQQIDQDEIKLVRIFRDNYLLIANDVGNFVYNELGKKAFSGLIGGLINWAITTAKKKVFGINVFTKRKINRIVDNAIQKGWTIQQTKKELQKEFKHMSEVRALTIARTEVNAAANRGSLEGAKQSKVTGLQKEWISTLDSRTRPTHRAANNQTVGLEEDFTVGGQKMQYPGDPRGGAKETIRCRCTLGYL